MAKNPLLPKRKAPQKFSKLNRSAGIFDDYAVRKNVATKEGTIEHTPIDDNHIVNKKYTDDTIVVDIAIHAALPNVHHNKLHASTHEVAGDDLVNHDDLTGFVANEHILPLAPIQMVQ